MDRVLDRQVRSYEESASQAARDESVVCRDVEDLEDLIDVGLALFEAAKNSVRRWQLRHAGGGEEFNVRTARDFVSLYRGLGAAFDRIDEAVERSRQRGYKVSGWDRFRQAHEELAGLLSISLEDLIEADEQATQGRTRPAGEIRDALRRRIHG